MSSKVIKWFKRQASIRRHSDKSDEKTSSSQNNSEEKKKSSFPRLSFRKRNKKKTASVSELPGESLAIVGISKKYSQSVPHEMESETRTSRDMKVSTSNTVSLDGGSMTTSPSKTDGYRSASELSYHSSFDYSKETNESLSLGEKETIVEINENSEEASKISNCDTQPTFHSVNSSISSTVKDQLSFVSVKEQPENVEPAAPIVKMEEICDVTCDKEHPVEEEENSKDHLAVESEELPVSDRGMSHSSEPISENINDNHLEHETCREKIVSVKEDKESHSHIENENEFSKPEEANIFEEIDRLVRDANSILDESNEETNCDNENKEPLMETSETKEGKREEETKQSENCKENIETLGDTLSKKVEDFHISEKVENSPSPSLESNNQISESVQPIEHDSENELSDSNKNFATSSEDKETLPDIVIQTNEKLEIVEEHEFKPIRKISSFGFKPTFSNENDFNKAMEEENVKITVTHPSPVRQSPTPNNSLVNTRSRTPQNHYPKELNPFGEDDSDQSDENNENCTKKTPYSCETKFNHNINVTPYNENGCHPIKENIPSKFERETNTNYNRSRSSSRNGRYEEYTSHNHAEKNKGTTGNAATSLNPFGESDDEEMPPFTNSSNPFDESDGRTPTTASSGRPSLPPKSLDLQNRKSSRGSLAPIPHPRKTKSTLHGSYTSLQNVSTYPVPAPRSITPYGSTRTLNESTNPFDDDDDDEGGQFERKGVGRSSLQTASSVSIQDPFSRSDSAVRGSLPPSSRVRIGRKKRPAPLPPGYTPIKPICTPDPRGFSSLPRKRSSTSPASDFEKFRKPPTTRASSPHGLPPPRPPPPKV